MKSNIEMIAILRLDEPHADIVAPDPYDVVYRLNSGGEVTFETSKHHGPENLRGRKVDVKKCYGGGEFTLDGKFYFVHGLHRWK